MDVFSLLAKLTLDSSEYEKGLDDSKNKAGGFASAIGNGLGTAAKVGAAAVGVVTTAAIGATTALVSGTSQVAAYGDNIDKMSQKMGMSSDAYQEWDAVMQHCGTSIESMQASMKTLSTAAETGNDAFKELGITEEELKNLNQEELFARTIEALQNVESDTQRTYLAGQLLGRGATELGALLNTSAEDTQRMKDRVHELGGVMSEEAVKAAAAYQDSLQDMQTAFSGLKRNLFSEFLPGITTVMDGLTELFAGNGDKGIGLIKTGIDGVAEKLTETLPKFADTGMQILKVLGDAIIENLPTFIDTGIKVIEFLVKAIIDSLPQLIEAAVQIIQTITRDLTENLSLLLDAAVEIIMALADGLVEMLPELIPAIVEIILKIVEKLTDPDTVGKLIDAALKIILALADGLIKAVPQLIAKAPEIVMNLVTALVENAPKILDAGLQLIMSLADGITQTIPKAVEAVLTFWTDIEAKFGEWKEQLATWGKDFIESFKSGIMQKWEDLKECVRNTAQKIKDFLGFSKPKEGPLSDADQYGGDFIKLFINGIDSEKGNLLTSVVTVAGDVVKNIKERWQNVKEIGSGLITAITGGIKEEKPELISETTETATDVRGRFMTGFESAETIGSNLINKLRKGMAEENGELSDQAAKSAENVQSAFSKSWDRSDIIGSNLLEKIKSGVGDRMPDFTDVFERIAESVKEFFERFADMSESSGKNVIISVINGIGSDISGISDVFRQIFDSIANAFRNVIDAAYSWGADMVANFCNGMVSRFNDMVETLNQMASAVNERLGFSEPEKGPLSDFHTYAPDMMAEFAKGIRDNTNLVTDQIDKSFDFGTAIGAAFGNGRIVSGITNTETSGNTNQRQQPAVLMIDRTVLGRVVYDLYTEEAQRVGVKLAAGGFA